MILQHISYLLLVSLYLVISITILSINIILMIITIFIASLHIILYRIMIYIMTTKLMITVTSRQVTLIIIAFHITVTFNIIVIIMDIIIYFTCFSQICKSYVGTFYKSLSVTSSSSSSLLLL